MPVPSKPKIYHIVHVDRLSSIISDGYLWCDSKMAQRSFQGTTIGMNSIKQRRLSLPLNSHHGLNVGDCVPFYFCPRSVMLYVVYRANHPELDYQGGQEPIIHLEADLYDTVVWATRNKRRWAFTLSNAGSSYFEDYSDLSRLREINWNAVQSNRWSQHKELKQAEFLVETSFPWELVSRIGVYSQDVYNEVINTIRTYDHRPRVSIEKSWYY